MVAVGNYVHVLPGDSSKMSILKMEEASVPTLSFKGTMLVLILFSLCFNSCHVQKNPAHIQRIIFKLPETGSYFPLQGDGEEQTPS